MSIQQKTLIQSSAFKTLILLSIQPSLTFSATKIYNNYGMQGLLATTAVTTAVIVGTYAIKKITEYVKKTETYKNLNNFFFKKERKFEPIERAPLIIDTSSSDLAEPTPVRAPPKGDDKNPTALDTAAASTALIVDIEHRRPTTPVVDTRPRTPTAAARVDTAAPKSAPRSWLARTLPNPTQLYDGVAYYVTPVPSRRSLKRAATSTVGAVGGAAKAVVTAPKTMGLKAKYSVKSLPVKAAEKLVTISDLFYPTANGFMINPSRLGADTLPKTYVTKFCRKFNISLDDFESIWPHKKPSSTILAEDDFEAITGPTSVSDTLPNEIEEELLSEESRKSRHIELARILDIKCPDLLKASFTDTAISDHFRK
jgi:hypothetical protein